MVTSVEILIQDIQYGLENLRNVNKPAHDYQYNSYMLSVEQKKKKYKYPFPTCCSMADFESWLDKCRCVSFREDINFCADCLMPHRLKMQAAGKCNRGGHECA